MQNAKTSNKKMLKQSSRNIIHSRRRARLPSAVGESLTEAVAQKSPI